MPRVSLVGVLLGFQPFPVWGLLPGEVSNVILQSSLLFCIILCQVICHFSVICDILVINARITCKITDLSDCMYANIHLIVAQCFGRLFKIFCLFQLFYVFSSMLVKIRGFLQNLQ